MSDGMGREFTYLSSHATNRYIIPNWGIIMTKNIIIEPIGKSSEVISFTIIPTVNSSSIILQITTFLT